MKRKLSTTVNSDTKNDPTLANFVMWLEENGFNLHSGTTLFRHTDHRGISFKALEPLKEDTSLFRIPPSFVLSSANSALFTRLKDSQAYKKLSDWNKLILSMMFEWTLSDSKWRPYLDILPFSLNTPIFWSEEERMRLLPGTDLFNLIGFDKIQKDFEENVFPIIRMNPDFFDPNVHNFGLYRRFGAIVMAYSFTDVDGTIAMMPMADMLNYKTGYNNARLFIEVEKMRRTSKKAKKNEVKETIPKREYEMKAILDIPAGSEIFNTYGDLANSELLLKYGYVEDESNPFDFVKLHLASVLDSIENALPRNSEFKNRLEFLMENNVIDDPEEEFPILTGDRKFPPPLEFIVSCFVCDELSWNEWTRTTFGRSSSDEDESHGHGHGNSQKRHSHGDAHECVACENENNEDENSDEMDVKQEGGSDKSESEEEEGEEKEEEILQLRGCDPNILKKVKLAILTDRLALYPKSSQSADEKRLKYLRMREKSDAELREMMALTVRLAEKEILNAVIDGLH